MQLSEACKIITGPPPGTTQKTYDAAFRVAGRFALDLCGYADALFEGDADRINRRIDDSGGAHHSLAAEQLRIRRERSEIDKDRAAVWDVLRCHGVTNG